jgi:preprotein translocase subunit SecG
MSPFKKTITVIFLICILLLNIYNLQRREANLAETQAQLKAAQDSLAVCLAKE